MFSIVWLRRDLRLYDNASLHLAASETRLIQPIFIFDKDILKDFDQPADKRLSFIAESLVSINEQLKAKGGELLVFYGRSVELVANIAASLKAEIVFAARDYEPATIIRDEKINIALKQKRITLKLVNDHLLFTPDKIVKKDNSPYHVFTPYSKVFRQKLDPSLTSKYDAVDTGKYAKIDKNLIRACGLIEYNNAEDILAKIGYQKQDLGEWNISHARDRLNYFANNNLENYKTARDFLAIAGTSKLSPYLRFGLISIRECLDITATNVTFSNELIWREFYAMILYHYPASATENFMPKYQGKLKWHNDEKLLEKFCAAETGFPVIDAAIIELKQTGWMHNRARMIVASFFTKHLLIDWRIGEKFFAKFLMDYELSSNVGGWQWAASTGTDAVPYFRIFNPILQSEKFDPHGNYIKKYIPTLKNIPEKYIHQPNKYKPGAYHEQIVDLKTARDRALKFYKMAN
jgi:deoxyribodipyrimidine photo-lyase